MYIYNDKIYTDGTNINNKYHMKSEVCKVWSKLLYDNEIKIDNDIKVLRSNFTGLHYMFCKVSITEDEAKVIRSGRK